MLDQGKVVNHLMDHFEDTNSGKDRFIKDMLILIEHGTLDADDEVDQEAREDDFY